eukprot:CCRYP_006595-RA/>CCRYP_006595-RA protein AED:0.01 eAED:0.01 QI:154/1/1/1/1/1/2/155/461
MKEPPDYVPALQQNSTAPLHISLELGGSMDTHQLASWVSLGKAIRNTRRFVRCLRLRFKDGDNSKEHALNSVLYSFGQELVGSASIESLVVEGKFGTPELECLKVYLVQSSLRGIKFHQTDINHSSFLILRDFFIRNKGLKVLDLSSNFGIDDEGILECIDAMLRGKANLETLNIDCVDAKDNNDSFTCSISGSGAELIAWFVSRTPSIVNLKLGLSNFNNVGMSMISHAIRNPKCSLSRLDLTGKFDDDGLDCVGRALKANQSVRTIFINSSAELTSVGGKALLRAARDDEVELWASVANSNHTLKSVIIAGRHLESMGNELTLQLRDITTLDPHKTIQSKAWHYVNSSMKDLSELGLNVKHMPRFLAFVEKRGGINALFNLLRNGHSPSLLANPTPERVRLTNKMEKIEQENERLRHLIKKEKSSSEEYERITQNSLDNYWKRGSLFASIMKVWTSDHR